MQQKINNIILNEFVSATTMKILRIDFFIYAGIPNKKDIKKIQQNKTKDRLINFRAMVKFVYKTTTKNI